MRLYTFCNFYLSSIQQGIQTAHLVAELFVKYQSHPTLASIALYDWATNHKTIITLNGGNHFDVSMTHGKLEVLGRSLNLPMAVFNEDSISLNNAVTCTGIVIPQHIYDYAAIRVHTLPEGKDPDLPMHEWYDLTSTEAQLADIIKSCSLAR